MIDYGVLPPEINSGRMYIGAGAGPMLSAATAWDVLADELAITGASFESTVLDLTGGPWRGPAATVMATAALPFATWLKMASAQAEQSASQAKAAAAAFETAFAMTVPPMVVAANRAQLMVLIATNFFGQNTPAIAANEAHYAAMWAQDAAAMYGYAGSARTASKVSPFVSPPQVANPAGFAEQAAATGHAVNPAPAMSTAMTAPQALAQLGTSTTAPVAPAPVAPGITGLLDQWTLFNRFTGAGFSPTPLGDSASQVMITMEHTPNAYIGTKDVLAEMAKAAEKIPKVGTAAAFMPAVGGGNPTVVFGNAAQIGALSVPPGWPGASAGTGPAPATLVASRAAALTAERTDGVPRAVAGMPGVPGASAAGSGVTGFRFVPRYGYRHKFMTRPPSAG